MVRGFFNSFLISVFLLLESCSTTPNSEARVAPPEERAAIMFDAALGSLKENDPTGALMYAAEAEKVDQQNPYLHHIKAVAYYRKHDLVRAYQSAKLAVTLKNDFSIAHNTLGKICLDTGRYEEAERSLLIAARDPLNREAFLAKTNLGILYYRQAKWGPAEVQFNSAAIEAPKVACVAYYYLGHLSQKKRQDKKSVDYYKKASGGLCGAFPDAHYALAIAFVRAKDTENARKKFLEIQTLFPENQYAEKAMAELRKLN